MSMVVKNGPQLTGAQALDVIIDYLEGKLGSRRPDPGKYWDSGEYLAYHQTVEFVRIMRDEKFCDPPTKEPWKALGESKSYGL